MMTPEEVDNGLFASKSDVYLRQKSVEISYGTISEKHDKGGSAIPATRMQRWFPSGFKYEAYELYKFAWPIVLTVFLNFLIRVSGTMFSGQLGRVELDAVSMGVSIANLIGTSVGIGLIAACDTLFAQSYGSVNKKQVGVYLQTACYISTLSCIVSCALLFNTNYILLALGQNPEVAKATEEFMYYFMPALFFLFLFQLLQKYLQVQGIVVPVVIIGVIANIVNIGLQYLVFNVFMWGIKGSAIGQSIAYFLLAALTLAYLCISGHYKDTWNGWSKRACRDWAEFMKLGLSSIAMICLEWWAYEVSIFLTGILGNVDLGASSISYQIWTIYASMPLGISSACAFRIGRYLGEERADSALTVARVSFVVAVALSVVSALVVLALYKQLPYLFSSDEEIIVLAEDLLLILAVFTLFGCAKVIFSGVIRGTGRQVAGGIISFVSYFIFALPIGIPLMFLTEARAAGFWWGLLIGIIIACFSLVMIIARTDWEDEVKQAQKRAKSYKRKRRRPSESEYTPADNETSGLLANGSVGLSSDTAPLLADDLGLSSSLNFSTSFQFDTSLQRRIYWRNIIIQKVVITAVCFTLFIFGIICRFIIFIPPEIPQEIVSNSTKLPSIWNVSSIVGHHGK